MARIRISEIFPVFTALLLCSFYPHSVKTAPPPPPPVNKPAPLPLTVGSPQSRSIALVSDLPILPYSISVRPLNKRSNIEHQKGKHNNLTTDQVIQKHKYPVESHQVITEDGFVLQLYRIPRGKYHSQNERRPAVYLQDGIHFTSSVWFMASEVSLPFLLADQGYDVWLGNSRESANSQHLKRNRTDAEYWDFGIEEIAKYDRAAIIDYIIRVTGIRKLNYIGFSLGTTELFILLSTKPEYNAKIAKVVAIAPLAYIHNTRSHISHMKDNPRQPRISMSPSDDTSYPLSKSRIVEHLNQWASSKTFCAFDYGEDRNRLRYPLTTTTMIGDGNIAVATPPKYNLSAVTVPVYGLYAPGDDIVVAEDSLRTLNELGNWANRETSQVQHPEWGHFDFLYADAIKTYVIDPVITFLETD